MGRMGFFKAFGGAAAAMAASALMAPGVAQAQYHDCTFTDGTSFYPGYTECGESAQGLGTLGSTLMGVGDAWGNQQLNVGGFAGFATPTGRLRHTNHDGLRDKATAQTTGEFEIDEASFFGNASYDLPGTYFGGKVRVSGLVGWTGMMVDNEAKTFQNDTDSLIYGGSYLWSKGSFYSMSMIIGLSGETDAENLGGSYNYDISGYFTNSVMGYTFDMAGGWKFDLRGNLSHYDIKGDSFEAPIAAAPGMFIKGSAEAWSAGLTGTIFTILEMNGGVARPYLSAQYRNVFDEDIKIRGAATVDFEQDTNFGKLEAGYDYVVGAWTYGAAVYTEFSGDEETVGGRIGLSVKLQ